MQIADFPHMKPNARGKLHKSMLRSMRLIDDGSVEETELSTEDTAKRLRALLG